MLNFSTTNIYTYEETLKDKLIGFLASRKMLLPFQCRVPKDGFFSDLQVFLKNGTNEIEITNEFVWSIEYTNSHVYIIHKAIISVFSNPLPCGVWQLKITYITNENIKTVYSNFFTIVPDNLVIGKFEYYNSTDFDSRIYQTGYRNYVNITNQIIFTEPFYKETILERGDGSKIYEHQSYAEQYNIVLFGDIWTVRELQKLQLFNSQILTIEKLGISSQSMFVRNTIEQTWESAKYYKITLNLNVNNLQKTLCQENLSIFSQENIAYPKIGDDIILINNEILMLKQ
jgi:hypothetical protein